MPEAKQLPPQNELREIFDYCVDTGKLFWRSRGRDSFRTPGAWVYHNRHRAGHEALCSQSSEGYLVGYMVPYGGLKSHRVIWKWMTGLEPNIIDHKNHDRTDNRWDNLRSVDFRGNARNCRLRANNSSGVNGVQWYEPRQKWVVKVAHKGKNLHFGYLKAYLRQSVFGLSRRNVWDTIEIMEWRNDTIKNAKKGKE